MEIVDIEVNKITPYAKNAKKHDQVQIDNVAESIRQFGFVQPIVLDKDNVVVIGHCRLAAAKKLRMKTVPCVYVDTLSAEQVAKLRLLDNKLNESAWDMELIAAEIADLDFDGFDIDWGLSEDEVKDGKNWDGEHITLADKFIAPPFSILDTRQGYWQERKKEWKSKFDSGEGRDDNLLKTQKLAKGLKTGCKEWVVPTSIFDPVLAETMYLWFCPKGGAILDPFCGGSVRGIVAESCGYKYTGFDLRQEQIDANTKQAEQNGVCPTYICDDSNNMFNHIQKNSFDFIFSCPPYVDLEVYSDDTRDLSTMEYSDFKIAYFDIIKKSVQALKDNRFACFVVGEVRDKKGNYYGFVKDTIQAFEEAGTKFYNECILVEESGTAAMRANRQFNNGRKIVKTHQNVLIFVNGKVDKTMFDEYDWQNENEV